MKILGENIMHKPKISIIIPVFNVEKYLNECIDSVMKQTLKDIEIIVINDGSTDSSIKIIEGYREKFKNIKIIDKKNEGVSVSRNIGIDNSTGEYIMFLDGDDYLDPSMCETMYKIVKKNKADVAECSIRKFNEISDEEDFILHDIKSEIEVISNEKALNMYLKYQIRGYVWNKIFKRDFIVVNKIKFPIGVCYEDMIVSLKTCIWTNKLVLINKPLYNYRERENSASRKVTEKNINDYVGEIYRCINYCNENIDIEKHKDCLDAFFIMNFLNGVNWYIKLYDCKYNKIYKNYNKYFGLLNNNFKGVEVLRVKTLSRNYKIIYILWKLRIYHLFIKLKII